MRASHPICRPYLAGSPPTDTRARGRERRRIRWGLVVLAALLGVAPPVLASVPGDTIGRGPVQLDVIDAQAFFTPAELVLRLVFDQEVTLGDDADPTALRGVVELDLDGSPFTGRSSVVLPLCPEEAPELGVDRFVDLFQLDSTTGLAPVLDEDLAVVATALVVVDGALASVRVPGQALDGAAAPQLAAIVGPPFEGTDCLSFVSGVGAPLEIPTLGPAQLALLAALLAAGALVALGRSR